MKTKEMTFDEIYEDYNYIMNTTDELDSYQTQVIMEGYVDNVWKNTQILKAKTFFESAVDSYDTLKLDLRVYTIFATSFAVTVIAGTRIMDFITMLTNV
jgi:hypothetical protein